MTTRRRFLALLGVATLATTGCSRMTAKRIEDMPREYALLMDPEQLHTTLGEQRLKISGADFGIGGTDFYKKEWENVHFYDCIFYGVIHLKHIRNCMFEHCQFPGSNFQASSMEDVLFMRSDTLGRAYVMAPSGQNVRFVECDFGGRDSERNHFGAISFGGSVSYERCTGQYMDVTGDTLVTYRDCKFGPIDASNGSAIDGKRVYATVTIDNCTFRGDTRLARSTLSSLTIRNSKFDVLDIGKSDVQGDVLIESVQAGAMIDEFDNARSITIRNSRFRGTNVNPKDWYPTLYRSLDCSVSEVNRKQLQSVVIDNVECGRDDREEFWLPHQIDDTVTGCWIMGGNSTTVIRNCKIPKALYSLNSDSVSIDNYEGESASFVRSKIGTLSFRATAIVKAIDFTGAQVQKLDAKGLVRFTGQKIVTTGSNVHVP